MSNVSLIDGHIDNAEHCVCCGRVIPENSQYCFFCGMKVENGKQRQIDRIRNMSVEELAEGIQVLLTAHLNKYGNALGHDTVFLSEEEKQHTINEWKRWLEQEVGE